MGGRRPASPVPCGILPASEVIAVSERPPVFPAPPTDPAAADASAKPAGVVNVAADGSNATAGGAASASQGETSAGDGVAPPADGATASDGEAGGAPGRSAFGWFMRGMRHAVTVPALVLLASYLGFGALLQGVGFPPWAGVLSTLLIWALPAQVILVGGLVSGVPLPALALAVGLSSIRFLPMTMSIAPYIRSQRGRLLVDLLCAHYVAMTMWLEGLRLLPPLPAEARVPFALGMGNFYVGSAMLGTVLGYMLAAEVPPVLAAALLLMTPLSFTLMLVRNSRTPTDWLAFGAGFVLMPLTLGLGGGLDLMIAGIGGGTLAYAGSRIIARRRA